MDIERKASKQGSKSIKTAKEKRVVLIHNDFISNHKY